MGAEQKSDVGESSSDDVKTVSVQINAGLYKCEYEGCQALFKKPSRLKQHICSHTGERPFKCVVPNCGKAYTHACHLKRHTAKCHVPQPYKKTFKCPFQGCELLLSNEFNLKRHFRRKHEKLFTCTECGESFSKTHLLRSHMYSHNGISTFRCEECETSFDTAGHLRRHQRCHKKYTCNIHQCGETLGRWSELRKHIKAAHPVEYICDVCGQKYKTKGNLLQHVRKHMKDRPTFPCPYEGCLRSYSRDIYLQNHIKWKHERVGGHRCTIDDCGRVLSTKARLLKHLSWHERSDREVAKRPTGSLRKARCDKGIPRRSMASHLTGITLSPSVEKKIINGLPVDIDEDITLQTMDRFGNNSSDTDEPQQHSENISPDNASAPDQLQDSN